MGYELNKLMKQYGVSTPGMVSYSGPTAPTLPAAPVEPTYDDDEGAVSKTAKKAAYEIAKQQHELYQKDPAAWAQSEQGKQFNEMMRKYGLAQKEYNQYRAGYQDRLMSTPMYADAQFKTGLKGEPVAPTYAAPIAAPSYGAVPVTLAGSTAQEKADYYKRLRDIGYTDPDIRGSTKANFGPIQEGDWRNLMSLAYPQYKSNVEAAYQNIGRGPTNIDDEGYNYWLNQLSTGAVKPEDLTSTVYNVANTWMPTATYDQSLIPKEFDWNFYLKSYPDLGKAGIDTIQEAQRHYALYGRNEGRSPYAGFGPVVGPVQPTTSTTETAPVVQQPVVQQPGGVFLEPAVSPDYGGMGGDGGYSHGGSVHGGSVHGMAQKYGMGGSVQGYSVGGSRRTPRGYESPEDEAAFDAIFKADGAAQTFAVEPQPSFGSRDSSSMSTLPNVTLASAPTTASDAPPVAAGTVAPVTTSPAAQPVKAPPAATTPVSPAATDLMGMLQKYLGTESTYGPELSAARKRVTAENAAFADMINNAMKGDTTKPDKTEMYFRLAAAFGAPTRTGHFAENLGLVGKELGEYSKDVRAAKKAERQMQLQLGIEAQKLKTQAARDELTTLRGLAGEEMKDKRAILQEYIKSGMPQSEAGKAAADAGLTRGTPEFTAFVNKYIEDKIATGNMLKEAMVMIAAGQLDVARSRERRTEESGKKLTAPEIKLKAEAEDSIGSIDDAMNSLKRAYSLNPNTFDGTLVSIAQRKILEQTDPKDPRVLATREQQNLLSKGAISNLRTAFGGNPTEGERKALLDLEGIDAKSKEERAQIMMNTYKLLKDRRAREQKRLNDISQGLYRETNPSAGGID